MDVTLSRTDDRAAWLVRIAAPLEERARILVELRDAVGEYHRAGGGTYRVAGHREPLLRRFAAQVRSRGRTVAWR